VIPDRNAGSGIEPDRFISPGAAARAAAVCAVAITYLSLVPFEPRNVSLERAWEIFRNAPLLDLGLLDRADWIANLVAYVPLGFLLAAAFQGQDLRRWFWPATLAVAAATLLAFAVEFTQVFFGPRTVSQNDLIAEAIGATAGALAWPLARDRLGRWARMLESGGEQALLAVLGAYALAYLGLSLFPYDFVTSASELAWKIRSGSYGLLFAGSQCEATGRCILRLGVEVLACAPLGWLWALWRREPGRASAVRALALGALLGLVLELVQFLVASGISQGASVLTRAVGFMLGAIVPRTLRSTDRDTLISWGRRASLLLLPLYLLVLLVAAGWPGGGPLSLTDALARMPQFRLMPFYYHYYVPEAHAVASALAHLALYAPVGAAAWVWAGASARGGRWAAGAAMLLAALAEASKAFLPAKHPDFTDVLIAGASAWLVFRTLQLASHKPRPTAQHAATATAAAEVGTDAGVVSAIGRRTAAAAMLAIVAVTLTDFPVYTVALAAGLVVYALALLRWPGVWLVVLPAALPVFDLAPWSGRFFWDEFDLLVLTTIAVRLARHAPGYDHGASVRLPKVALWLLAISTVASAVLGLLPLQALDANAFTNYLGHYNALRIAKPVLWAFALLALATWEVAERRDPAPAFALGMALGGVLTAAAVAWERWLFPGVLDFTAEFRVGGPVSAMHVGSAYVEGCLVAAFPFVALRLLQSRTVGLRVLWLGAVGLMGYAVLVTYSRGGVAGLVVATAVMLVAALRAARPSTASSAPRRLTAVHAVSIVLALGIVATPIVAGRYLAERFMRTPGDFDARISHWRKVLDLMNGSEAMLVGMGLGRFPVAYYWGGAPVTPASYRFGLDSGGNKFLRLNGGYGLFFDQRVAAAPSESYTLSFRARSPHDGAALSVALCQKALLYSAGCSREGIRTSAAWNRYTARLDAIGAVESRSAALRPISLTLHNGQTGTSIEVDDVSLRDSRGRELVRNGDFGRNADFWFFTSDDHWAWHVENLPLHVFFERGALGVLAFGLLLWSAFVRLLSSSSPVSAALLASLAGFLAVGLFGSLIDAPRHMLLFLMLLFMPHFLRQR